MYPIGLFPLLHPWALIPLALVFYPTPHDPYINPAFPAWVALHLWVPCRKKFSKTLLGTPQGDPISPAPPGSQKRWNHLVWAQMCLCPWGGVTSKPLPWEGRSTLDNTHHHTSGTFPLMQRHSTSCYLLIKICAELCIQHLGWSSARTFITLPFKLLFICYWWSTPLFFIQQDTLWSV